VLGQHFFTADRDLVQFAFLAGKAGVTIEAGDLVLLEQATDTAGQLGDDGVLAADHGRHVDGHALGGNAVHGEGMVGFFVEFGRAQQGLGRDAAHVQAGAAEARFTLGIGIGIGFGTGGIETELGSANGSHVTAGATTDDEDVELLGHVIPVRSKEGGVRGKKPRDSTPAKFIEKEGS